MKKLLEQIFPDQNNWFKTGIYKIYHLNNLNKVYIGSAVQTKIYGTNKKRRGFYGRLYYHLWSLNNNKHHSPKLQNFVNKYGIEGLQFEIIEFCNKDISKQREEFYIKNYNSVKTGFNCSHDGHVSGATLSIEVRKKISEKVSKKLKGKTPANWESIKGMRAKIVLEYQNDIFIREYRSLTEMCLVNNLSYKAMSVVLCGKSSLPKKFVTMNIRWEYKK